ncbi:MAG: hypothetical protein FWC89_14170, partial [Defluviitaleaceae bacterium]|nr:hypothetical protein [Defluviitaleaceae bacterium]
MKKFMVVVVLFAMLFAYNSMQTHATVGPLTEELRILADGESFTLWAVGNDTGISAFRLEDIAYILNGTPAQFNLRPAPDGFHYWIVRGEAYTPTGQEFRPVYYTISQGTMWANTSYMRIRVG